MFHIERVFVYNYKVIHGPLIARLFVSSECGFVCVRNCVCPFEFRYSATCARCANRMPVVALEAAHEIAGKHTCDKRLSKTALRAAFPLVDFGLVDSEEDPFWGDGSLRESHSALAQRGADLVAFLKARCVYPVVSQSPCQDHYMYSRPLYCIRLFYALYVASHSTRTRLGV
jgi:hypothetical protein